MNQLPVMTSRQSRSRLASARAAKAFRCLQACRLCAWNCGVDRLSSRAGRCHAGSEARYFISQTEVADELELVPTFAIALSGCNLRCDFCITGSQSWNAAAGQQLGLKTLAGKARRALASGARTVMIYGGEPTIHLPRLLALVAALPEDAPLVLKTNGYLSSEARELLDGIFDVWLPDFKFGNDTCARRISGVEDYTAVLKENVLWASEQPNLIIRHLLLPGHLDCCWKPIATWISENLPLTKVSLRTAFWPGWHSTRHPELLGQSQAAAAIALAESLQLRLVE